MVYAEIFATLAEVQYKAGAGASATSKAAAYVTAFMFQAESFINAACRYNFSDNYATLNDDTKGILKEAASNLAAIYVIQYDMSGFASRVDAEDMVNILRDAALRCIALLKEKQVTDFIREVA
jgi:hypothetical protein